MEIRSDSCGFVRFKEVWRIPVMHFSNVTNHVVIWDPADARTLSQEKQCTTIHLQKQISTVKERSAGACNKKYCHSSFKSCHKEKFSTVWSIKFILNASCLALFCWTSLTCFKCYSLILYPRLQCLKVYTQEITERQGFDQSEWKTTQKHKMNATQKLQNCYWSLALPQRKVIVS